MKRFCLLLTAMVAMAGAAFAESASYIQVGYCEGIVQKAGNSAFATDEADTWVSEAIYLPTSVLERYIGNQIDSLRAGTSATLNIETLTLWIRTDLDGENVAEVSIDKTTTPKFKKGWNTVALETPYQITADTPGLYIGYSYLQTKRSLALSIVPPSVLPTQENALFTKLGTNAEWTDSHESGTASVEAVVSGDNLPQYDIVLKSLSVPAAYVISKGYMTLGVTVRNVAAATLESLNMKCVFDGVNVYNVGVSTNIPCGTEETINFTVSPDCYQIADEDAHTVTVTVEPQGADIDMSNNSASGEFYLIQEQYDRVVLIEEFTTESCGNCPRVAGFLHEVLENPDYASRATAVCHHAGYYTDWLTIPEDQSYLWFYNAGGSTYAPGMMFDRVSSMETSGSTTTPVICPGLNDIYNAIDARSAVEANVSIYIKATLLPEDNEVTVQVYGKRAMEDFTVNPPRLVVGLLEDSIKAHSQSGGGSNYYQMHVNRAYNDTWGVEMEWDGDNYNYTCTLPVEEDYVREKLSILAYVWDYDPNSVPNCEVSQAASLPASEFSTSVEGISDVNITPSQAEIVGYYGIDGRRLINPETGIVIVRYSDGTARKVILK